MTLYPLDSLAMLVRSGSNHESVERVRRTCLVRLRPRIGLAEGHIERSDGTESGVGVEL